MTLLPWSERSRETLARYKVFHVTKARRVSPRTGEDIGFFLIETGDWVNVIPVTEDDEVVLVRQFRHGSATFSLEIPGGILHDRDEDPALAAARELREETGYVARELRLLGRQRPNPALFTNWCTTYLALGCTKQAELQMDPGEDIEVVTAPMSSIPDMIARGEIDHSLVLAAFALNNRGQTPIIH
jgi:8-oxo-dGTP pyrophosphatase MutT (NUDIX family)